MLCPDFALSVNADDEPLPDGSSPAVRSKASTSTRVSPERVAGVPRKLEE